MQNANGNGTGSQGRHSENELHLRDAVNLLRRNMWIITFIALSVIGLTGWYTWTRAPIFEAQTTIHVDTDRGSTAPQLDFLSNMLGRGDVETEMALLRARKFAELAVDSLALQVQIVSPVARPRSDIFSSVSATQIARNGLFTFTRTGDSYQISDSEVLPIGIVQRGEAIVFNGVRLTLRPTDPNLIGEEDFPDEVVISVVPFRDAVKGVSDALSVGLPFREASLVSVSYTGTDPELVQAVPDRIAELYRADRVQAKRTAANSQVDFLVAQIGVLGDSLLIAENELLDYQEDQQIVNIEAEGAEQVRRMVEAEAEVDEIGRDLTNLEGLLQEIDSVSSDPDRNVLTNPYRRLAGYPALMATQSVTELLTQLNQLEADYVQMSSARTREHPDVRALAAQIGQLQQQLYQLAVNYRSSLNSSLQTARATRARFGDQLGRIPTRAVEQARLERRKVGLEEVYLQLQGQLQEARIAQAIEPGDVRIVDAAVLPTLPIRPRKVRSMILAIIFGFILGIGFAAARDYLDETVHSREELIRLTNLPVLAMIPRIKGAGGPGLLRRARAMGDRLVTKTDVGNPVSEAYRAFRTNITFLDLDSPAKSLVFTSPGPAEGKSTSASNLAITLAQQGSKTVLVDCDLRKGIVHKIFDAKDYPGVTDVLMGTCTLEEAIQTVEINDDAMLSFIPTGTLPPNPSELIGSRQMRQFLEMLTERFDKVLLDSPPLNLVTDAAVLGTMSDAVILIARAGHTARGALKYANDQLNAVRAPISGIVLNDLDYAGRGRYYGSGAGYGYYYRYYGQDKKKKQKA